MDLKAKEKKLKEIYERFEKSASEYKKDAICKIGCGYCCTAGSIDITTLEGLVIRAQIKGFSKPLKSRIKKKLAQNKHEKESQKIAQCPFLKEDQTCLIYEVRPFSCRQLYSVRECRDRGPTIHRRASELAKTFIQKLQRLDETGYSGHISFILYLLERPEFRKLYQSGGFDPVKIMDFGKGHGIVINRIVA
ncbi:YkgJ family cysteine cluster protein [Thermodesulfobacteriota bacterium]